MEVKRILTLLGIMLLLSCLSVFALTFNQDNTKIIYGINADIRDFNGATDIRTSITDGIVTKIIGVGNESVLIQSHGNDLNFNERFNSVVNKLTYKDLPVILAEGEVEYEDGSDEDYTQILKFGNNSVVFGSLDEEDYVINTNSSSKEIPILYVDLDKSQSKFLWELIVEFDDPLDATELDDYSIITIAGKEYNFKPDMEETDDELVLYASGERVSLELDEIRDVVMGGEIVTLELVGADDEGDEDRILIKVDGVLKKIRENKCIGVHGEKIYVNNIMIRTIPDYKVIAELFIGAEELTIDISNNFNTVEINGNGLDGIKARVIGEINATEQIEFHFIPTEMDDIEDEIEYLEIGESVIDPLFGTISVLFESTSSLDSEDRDLIKLESLGDELEVTFTNVDDNEISFIPYEINASDDLNQRFINGNVGEEEDIFIVQVSGDITEVFRIESIKTDEVEIYSYTEDEDKDYQIGDELENTIVTITNISGTNITFSSSSSDILISENEMEVSLLVNSVEFDETEIACDEDCVATKTWVNLTVNNNDIEIESISGANITEYKDKDGDYEYAVTNGYTTYFKREVDDGRCLEVYVPEEENDFNIYVSDTVITREIEPVEIVFNDEEADTTDANLIVVGGSCINSIAAELLGYPYCGESFTEKTGIGAGEFMIKSYPWDGKLAVLIAGYHVGDTEKAVEYFLEENPTIDAGTEIKKKSSDYSDIV